MRSMHRAWPVVALCGGLQTSALLLSAAQLPAQTLGERIQGAPDGVVRMTVPARAGVCGNGESIRIDSPDGDGPFISTRGRDGVGSRQEPCEPGPLRIEMRVRNGQVEDVSTRIANFGANTDRVTDLGNISGAVAVDYLLGLAARAPEGVGKDAIFLVVVADAGPVHPELLRLARNEDVPSETRQSAVFWLSQLAGEVITRELGEMVESERVELEVREHVVFALSQRPREEGIPILLRVVRSNPNPRLRQQALFWLGQTGDPRALAIIEEILLRQ